MRGPRAFFGERSKLGGAYFRRATGGKVPQDALQMLLGPNVPSTSVPFVYFDTSVISWAATGRIKEEVWGIVSRYVRRHAHHAISINTTYELLAGLAYGVDERFVFFRDRFKFLSITPDETFLPLAGEFVRTRVFDMPLSRPDFDPERLRQWIPIVLRARSRRELLDGSISLDQSNPLTFGINLRLVQCHILKGKASYIRRLKRLRVTHPGALPIQRWASGMVGALRIPMTAENRQRVEEVLNAVYFHDLSTRQKSLNASYNFKKGASAWLDSMQLHYLADSSGIFVTADQRLKSETHGSSQAARVITFDELVGYATKD